MIPDDIKEEWNGFASVVEPHKPPFDGSSHITGHNLFVSAYHGLPILIFDTQVIKLPHLVQSVESISPVL